MYALAGRAAVAAVAVVALLAVAPRPAAGALPLGSPPTGSTSALLFPHPGSAACTHRLRTYYCAAGCKCAPAGGCYCTADGGAGSASVAVGDGVPGGHGGSDSDGTAFTAFDGQPFRALGGVPALEAGGHVALLSDAGVRINALFVAGKPTTPAAAAASSAAHPLLMRSVGLLGGADALRIHACGRGRLCLSAGAVEPTEVAGRGGDAASGPSPPLLPIPLTPGREMTLPGGAVVTAARWPRGDVVYATLGGVYQVRVAAVTAPWAPRQLELAVRLVGLPSAPSGLLGKTVERVLPEVVSPATTPALDDAVWAVGGLFTGAAGGLDRYGEALSAAAKAAATAAADKGVSTSASRRQLLGVGALPGVAWAEATALAD
ncbi:hypothetical protein MMPV_006896 [Pyropia vietnamensis]